MKYVDECNSIGEEISLGARVENDKVNIKTKFIEDGKLPGDLRTVILMQELANKDLWLHSSWNWLPLNTHRWMDAYIGPRSRNTRQQNHVSLLHEKHVKFPGAYEKLCYEKIKWSGYA